jgi:hypothetical protein
MIELLMDVPADGVGLIADFLLANGVIVPPCKVGDDVWWIDLDEETIKCAKADINAIAYYGGEEFRVIARGEYEPEKLHTEWCMLTKAEAEERLSAMRKAGMV